MFAQTYNFDESYRWVHFTTEAGLPSNQITALYIASDNTIWTSTSKGPAWYNGYKWITVQKTNGEPITNTIRLAEYHDSICIAQESEVLIGLKNDFHTLIGGVTGLLVSFTRDSLFLLGEGLVYVYANGIMNLYNISPIPPTSIIFLWKTTSGSVWFRTRSTGYRLNNGIMTLMYASPHGEQAFVWAAENKSGTGIFSISSPQERRGLWEWDNFSLPKHNLTLSAGAIIAGDILPNGDAIVVYNSGEIQFRKHGAWQAIAFSDCSVENIKTVKFDNNGDLWFATSNGIFLYRAMLQEWKFSREPGPDFKNDINEILKMRDGSLWLASSYGVGVQHVDGKTTYINSINGTSINGVTALAEDDSGRIWIGSGGSFPGTYRWDGKQWRHFSISDTEEVFVHKIRKDRSGRLWFLGLGKYSLNSNVHQPGAYLYTKNIFTRWGKEEGLLSGRVYSFVESNDGAYWFGTSAGLCKWKQGVWKHWKNIPSAQSTAVISLAAGVDGKIWGSFMSDEHLFWIGPDDSMQKINPEYRTSQYALDLKIDSFGLLWAATTNGLLSYDGYLWTHYDRRTGLQKEVLQAVLPTSNEIYCATDGHGLAILQREASIVPPPIITIVNPVVEEYSAFLRWETFPYRGEILPEDISTRFRINGHEWSQWSKQHSVQFDSLTPGSYTMQVQAKGTHGNINRLGQYATFVIEQPLLLRPLVFYPLSLTGCMIIVLIGVILIRRRAHAYELAMSEAKFRSVVTTTTSAIIVHKDGVLLFFNPYLLKLTGYDESEMKSKSFYDIIHPHFTSVVQQFERGGTDDSSVLQRFECLVITKSLEDRWWDITSAKVNFQNQYATFVTAFDITDKKKSEERTKSLTAELSQTEDRERRRLAIFLHDVISQTIAVSKMKLRRVLKNQVPLDIEESLTEVHELLEQSLTDAQTLTFELCPPVVYESDLITAIHWLADRFNNLHSIAIEIIEEAPLPELPQEIRNVLFQAIRESLANIVKHANAQKVTLSLNVVDSNLQIAIVDNGKGFDPVVELSKKKQEGGFGLFNIKERLGVFGGTVTISSVLGSGTTLAIILPLDHSGINTIVNQKL